MTPTVIHRGGGVITPTALSKVGKYGNSRIKWRIREKLININFLQTAERSYGEREREESVKSEMQSPVLVVASGIYSHGQQKWVVI